jgi:hypothetical protein
MKEKGRGGMWHKGEENRNRMRLGGKREGKKSLGKPGSKM